MRDAGILESSAAAFARPCPAGDEFAIDEPDAETPVVVGATPPKPPPPTLENAASM